MNYKISNSKLSVEISSKGGELRSIQDTEGKEYLWLHGRTEDRIFFRISVG